MAELGVLQQQGINIPSPQIVPVHLGDPVAPIPSTAPLSRAQGRAALYGSIANVLSSLPDTIMTARTTAKKAAIGDAVTAAYKSALSGNPVAGTSLSDFKATSGGDVSFSPAAPKAAPKATLPSAYDVLGSHLNTDAPVSPAATTPFVEPPFPTGPAAPAPEPAAPTAPLGFAAPSVDQPGYIHQPAIVDNVAPTGQLSSMRLGLEPSLEQKQPSMPEGNAPQLASVPLSPPAGAPGMDSGADQRPRPTVPPPMGSASGPAIITPGLDADASWATRPRFGGNMESGGSGVAPSPSDLLYTGQDTPPQTLPSLLQFKEQGLAFPYDSSPAVSLAGPIPTSEIANSSPVAGPVLSATEVHGDVAAKSNGLPVSGAPLTSAETQTAQGILPPSNFQPAAKPTAQTPVPQLGDFPKTPQDAALVAVGLPPQSQPSISQNDGIIPAPGRGTSYGYKGDTYGGPSAKASMFGPMGNKLDANSMAVSPDIEKQFTQAGYKLGDMVPVHTADGQVVTRRWDDRTATDAQAAKLGLQPLRGRFDFHADPSGNASSLNDAKIVGFSPPSSAAPSAGTLVASSPEVDRSMTAIGANGVQPASNFLAPAKGSVYEDPITHFRHFTDSQGRTGYVAPDEPHKVVFDKADAEKRQSFGSIDELHAFEKQNGVIAGAIKAEPSGRLYADSFAAMPKLDRDTQKRLNEANATGANISVTGKTPEEVTAALAAYQSGSGTLTDAQINHVQHLRDRFSQLPIYKNSQNVIDGFHNATLASSSGSGIGDKTMIEEGQRVLNPGNGVAAQTMKMFSASSGLLQRLTPDYIASHFTKGAIFTPEQRKEYLGIIANAYQERIKDLDEAAQQHVTLAKQARVPEAMAGAYFDNPYKVSALRNNNPPQGVATGSNGGAISPKDQEAAEWVKANPTNPKAAQVKAALQARGISVQ